MIAVNEGPPDKALPHLATALDVAAMRTIFEDTVLAGTAHDAEADQAKDQLQIRDCQIERIRYKPGENCLICYRLKICDRRTQVASEQFLCARMYETGGAASRFAKAQRQPLITPKFGRPLTHVPALDMVVWAFPNDRKLAGLPKLVDPTALGEQLQPLIAAGLGREWRIRNLTHDLAHYNPEHTCMVRVQLQLQHGDTGEKQNLVVYGKTYYNDQGAETYQFMRELWDSEARRSGRLRIAQPLGYHPQLKTLWQLGLPGETLLEQNADRACSPDLLCRAAGTLAALHQTPVSRARSSPLNEWVGRLEEMRHWLPRVRPACASHLNGLVDRLVDQAGCLGTQPIATLHGDLHLQNFFVDGGQVALIDLDNLHRGSPWQDVGSFVAGLFYLGLLTKAPDPATHEIIDVFCQAYAQSIPWDVSTAALNWYTAAALINERAFRSVSRLKAGRLDILDDLIELATQVSLRD
jgi:hypothetical protein